MPDNDLLQWMQSRGFYASLILLLLGIGLLLALLRRRTRRKGDANTARRSGAPARRKAGRQDSGSSSFK